MENIDFEKIGKDTRFLSRFFLNKKIDFPFNYGDVHQEEVGALKESIEIIKSRQYSRHDFKQSILSVSAPEFWRDLYWLEYYKKGKEDTEASFKKQQADYDSDPDKDDILLKYRFDEVKKFKQKNIEDIDNIINLVKEFRALINEAFPELENEFAQLLQKHNDLQVSEANRIQVRDEERKLKVEEKLKRIEEKKKQEENQGEGQANQSTKPPKSPKTFESYFIKPEYETAFWGCLKKHERLTPQDTIIQYDSSTKYGDVIAIIEVLKERGYTNRIPLIKRHIFAEKLLGEPCKPNTQARKNTGAAPDIKRKYQEIIPPVSV